MSRILKVLLSHFFCLALLANLYGCKEESVEDLVGEAKVYLEQKDYQAAIINLKNAVAKEPDNGELRHLLGRVQLSHGSLDASIKNLNRAVELGELAAYSELTRAHFFSSNYDEVLDLYSSLSRKVNFEHGPKLHVFISALRSNQRSPIHISEFKGDFLKLAQISVSLKAEKFDDAKDKLMNLENDKGEIVLVKLYQGLTSLGLGDGYGAIEPIESVVNTMPTYNYAYFLLVEAYFLANKLQDAEYLLSKMETEAPKNPQIARQQATLNFKKYEYEKALRYADKARAAGLNSTSLQIVSGVAAYELKNYEMAYDNLKRVISVLPPESSVQAIFLEVQLLLGKVDEAYQTLNLSSEVAEEKVYESVGVMFAQKGNIESSLNLLALMNEKYDSGPFNQLREGILKLQLDDESGVENIKQAITEDKDIPAAWLLLSHFYMTQGNFAEAISVAKKWQLEEPVSGLLLESLVEKEKGSYDKAIELNKKAQTLDSKNLYAKHLMLELLISNKQYDEAYSLAKLMLDSGPDDLTVLFSLVRLNEVAPKSFKISEFLQEQIASGHSTDNTRVALASVYQSKKEYDAAIKTIHAIVKNDSLYGLLLEGDLLLSLNKKAEALEAFKKLQQLYPENVLPWLRFIGINKLLGNEKYASFLAKKAYSIFPNNFEVAILYLEYLVKANSYIEARSVLNKNALKTSNNPLKLKLEAEVLVLEGKYDEALEILEAIYAEHPSFEIATLLAQVLPLEGQYEKAKALLMNEFDNLANKSLARHTLAEFCFANQDYNCTKKFYLDATLENARDFVALNNLASLNLHTKEYKEALEFAERAYNIASQNIAIVDTYGYALLKAGNVEQAVPLLKEAYRRSPNNSEIAKHWNELNGLLDKKF
ncbi:tetratricopeptide repeat protein [Alteromonas macleodii]|uniref:tetratricopeptide repeat protein n=1 Tax=Alteromonas macleodii TaxID=28108 RepID=UPI002982A845|nr:tetratricopeptide repeat protein [Alteromonas macleodii]MDW5285634.1 tetratricopeptide repeat protein [Alteromonas macleodii]